MRALYHESASHIHRRVPSPRVARARTPSTVGLYLASGARPPAPNSWGRVRLLASDPTRFAHLLGSRFMQRLINPECVARRATTWPPIGTQNYLRMHVGEFDPQSLFEQEGLFPGPPPSQVLSVSSRIFLPGNGF